MATAAASRYAKAVFELARDEGSLDAWGTRLARITQLFADPEVAAVLRNPTIPTERRETLVETVPHLLDEEATNLARLLIESGRVADAPGVEAEYQRLVDEAQGRVRATVTTAIELGPHDRDRVARELSQKLEQEVRLEVVVDPRVVGGMKLQYGDRVIDATVAARLQQLRRRLAAS